VQLCVVTGVHYVLLAIMLALDCTNNDLLFIPAVQLKGSYSFGSRFGDRNLGANDDGSITTSFSMPFYNRAERVLRVSIVALTIPYQSLNPARALKIYLLGIQQWLPVCERNCGWVHSSSIPPPWQPHDCSILGWWWHKNWQWTCLLQEHN